jgi:hypothetical protein
MPPPIDRADVYAADWPGYLAPAAAHAIDTATGRLIARIPADTEPLGLCVWPQPGRYSLGHTGILR